MEHRREKNGYTGIVESIKIQTNKGDSNKKNTSSTISCLQLLYLVD